MSERHTMLAEYIDTGIAAYSHWFHRGMLIFIFAIAVTPYAAFVSLLLLIKSEYYYSSRSWRHTAVRRILFLYRLPRRHFPLSLRYAITPCRRLRLRHRRRRLPFFIYARRLSLIRHHAYAHISPSRPMILLLRRQASHIFSPRH